jgi:hypothetical protein
MPRKRRSPSFVPPLPPRAGAAEFQSDWPGVLAPVSIGVLFQMSRRYPCIPIRAGYGRAILKGARTQLPRLPIAGNHICANVERRGVHT